MSTTPALRGGPRAPVAATSRLVRGASAAAPSERAHSGTSRIAKRWVRVMGSAVAFAILIWHLGTDPFVDGVRAVDGRALAAAVGLGALTAVCCAWRWQIVAGGLGIDLRLPAAVAAYYRSLFLNVTLPGGIVGDVHRGVSHGRDVSDVGRALRAVAWERAAGQVVQVVLTLVILLALPSPVRSYVPVVAIALLLGVLGVVLVARARPGARRSACARLWATVARDIREALLARGSWARIAFASALVVCGHAIAFLIAAQTAGTTAPASRMLPLALLVMLAMVLPSVGGWGPREGATAWAFAAAGLGAEQGVATAVVYGTMVLAANLPGAAFLVVPWSCRTLPPGATEPPLAEEPTHV